jgi:hypothetical protein
MTHWNAGLFFLVSTLVSLFVLMPALFFREKTLNWTFFFSLGGKFWGYKSLVLVLNVYFFGYVDLLILHHVRTRMETPAKQ